MTFGTTAAKDAFDFGERDVVKLCIRWTSEQKNDGCGGDCSPENWNGKEFLHDGNRIWVVMD